MRFVSILFLFFISYTVSGWAQSFPKDTAKVNKPIKYLLRAKGPAGEVFSRTGRIVKAIALSRPQSLEIAHIYLNYSATVKLNTDKSGETNAIVSFHAMKLSGDLIYKGINIEDRIFPSLVAFRLILPGVASATVTAKQVLAEVTAADVNSGDWSVSVGLHKKVTIIPVIDKLAFYHSADDFKKAEDQMNLIDLYYAAGWVMNRKEKLLDLMQLSQLNDRATFLASNLEFIMLNDWLIRQHFNQYPVFQKNDTLNLAKRMNINGFRKKLIDQGFIKLNVIGNEDLLKAANLFAENLANYFDTSQPDLVKATYLAQMAGSRLSSIGYNSIHGFVDSYAAVHKNCKVDWQLFVKGSTLLRHAMTVKASQLADEEQYSEAMGLLNASANYDLQKENKRSLVDSLLMGKLSQRLYVSYLDIAHKSLNVGIYRVTNDYYQKAVLLKQNSDGAILQDSRERYVADMMCKAMLESAGKSFMSNDIETALATYAQVITIADSARLKNAYEKARTRLEIISNRPSGYKPWSGVDVAVIVPVKESVKTKNVTLTVSDKINREEKDSVIAEPIKTIVYTNAIEKSGGDSIVDLKKIKPLLTKIQAQDIKDSAFLAVIIQRAIVNKGKQIIKDSTSLANINQRISLNQLNKKGNDSTAYLAAIKKRFLLKTTKKNIKDSVLLAANSRNFQAIQLKLTGVSDTRKQSLPNQKLALSRKKVKRNVELLPVDSVYTGVEKPVVSLNITEIKEQVSANIKLIHLEIWSGDTISSAKLLNKTDSLQALLALTGDIEFERAVKVLKLNYNDLRCEQQKTAYLHEIEQIRDLIKVKQFSIAGKQLQNLIAKSYTVSCKVDKSEAIGLLASLESPLVFKSWKIQLDSITGTQEPEAIMEAFEQANAYYHANSLDSLGIAPPDMMKALKSRRETAFLLKAILQLLNTHRPAYALELLKEIYKLEPNPDITISMQKRIGEMLASGDHSAELNVTDKLNSYYVTDKWYDELNAAYKKQWKIFGK